MKVEGRVLNRSWRVNCDELCNICHISHEELIEIVKEGIIEPQGGSREEWQFHGQHLKKVQIVLRLQKDLRVNLPGAAVAINLLEEIEELREKLTRK